MKITHPQWFDGGSTFINGKQTFPLTKNFIWKKTRIGKWTIRLVTDGENTFQVFSLKNKKGKRIKTYTWLSESRNSYNFGDKVVII